MVECCDVHYLSKNTIKRPSYNIDIGELQLLKVGTHQLSLSNERGLPVTHCRLSPTGLTGALEPPSTTYIKNRYANLKGIFIKNIKTTIKPCSNEPFLFTCLFSTLINPPSGITESVV